jgi:uncharacterized membrane protein YgcG
MTEELTSAIADLDDSRTVVLIQPFDNSIFYSCKAHGEKILTRKGKDGKFHVEGELKLISKEDMKEIFLLILPLIKAAKGKRIIIMGSLPRYLLARCCGNPGHLTNRNGDNYIDEMIQAIRDVYSWINNTIFMRRIKGVKIFNPTHALGFNDYDVNIDTIIDLWGDDPVHPTPAAYKVLADKLASMVDDMLAEPASVPASPTSTKKRAAPRKPWIVSSEPVAKRLIPALSSRGGTSSAGGSGRGGNSSRGGSRGGYHDRGGRGHRGVARGRGGNPRGAGQPAHHNRGRGKYAYSAGGGAYSTGGGRWPRGRGGY